MLATMRSVLRPEGFGPTFKPPQIYVLEVKREPAGKTEPVVHWVLVEVREVVERDPTTGEVQSGALSIFYWDLNGDEDTDHVPNGEFSSSYDRAWNAVSVTAGDLSSGGYVLIEPRRLRGAHLGTYLMNIIVKWAKQWPNADVREIQLLESDAHDDNRLRRNRFYEQFGIKFIFQDARRAAGVSEPMLAASLTEVTTWEKSITEHNLVKYMRRTANEMKMLSADLHFLRRENASTSRTLGEAYQKPVTWMLKRLVTDNLTRSFIVGTMTLVTALCLYRLFD